MRIKELLKEIGMRFMAILMGCMMLTNYILPFNIVHADDIYTISFSATDGHTMEKDNGHLKIDGQYVDFKSSNVSIGEVNCESSTSCQILVSDEYSGVLDYNADNKFTLYNTSGHVPYDYSPINSNTVFMVEDAESGGDQAEATINLSPGTGTYIINGEEKAYDDQIELYVNGFRWDHEAGDTITYDSDPQDDTVVLTFETLWINRFYDEIVINGTSYDVSDYIDFDDRTSWLEHNKGTQFISFDIDDVEKANSYNIVVKHGENNGTRYLATFLWTGDPAQAGGFDYIGHARLELVQATYTVGTETYIVDGAYLNNRLEREGDHLVASDGNYLTYGILADVDFDDGGLTLPGEATVTMRVVPEYGYQVTSVNGGSDFTTTDEGVSEFTLVVHNGEAGYFQATVEAVDDEVIANADEIKEGTITIDGDEIDSGTVQLTVDNVDLDEDKIKDFENAAGDNKIINYFDINLMQVLYRGTSESVWSNQIHRLDSEATISLKLDEGIDINDIVFVHNIDDGDEFEIIEIESWDPTTRIVTFKTNSFSNYAIASKASSGGSTTPDDNKANPKTGDNIVLFISILGISLVLLAVVFFITKKKKTDK